jgi:hypothetical protein
MEITELNIEAGIENWLKKLEEGLILVKAVRNNETIYHLNTQAKFIYSKPILKEIKEARSENEEGGYILCQPSIKNSVVILEAKEVAWIKNVSDSPHDSYVINTPAHKIAEKNSYSRQLLPIRFHTHPMDVKDINLQSKRLLQIIDTSDSDKDISFGFPFTLGGIKILLPDVLVVWDIKNVSDSFFIGVYNGLVAPIGFLKHRIKVTKDFKANIGESVNELIEGSNNFVKTGLVVGSFITVVAAMCYPMVSLPILQQMQNQTPILAIGAQKENQYFGLADINSIFEFAITIPKITRELIDENEIEIIAVRERIRKAKMLNN